MDVGTIIGMVGAWVLLAYGAGTQNLLYMIDMNSLIIVIGGTFCYILTCSPLYEIVGLVRVFKNVFIVKIPIPSLLIERIVGFAETARREGILALEQSIEDADDPFMAQGIRLAVDGTEPDLIVDVLETEMECIRERHQSAQALLNLLGDAAPAFGMIGTLIGLIVMLNNMDDPSQIGPGMAVAIITTLYGALLCNLVFKPVAKKLNTYSNVELLSKRLIVEGIMAIQSGDNPRIVEQKLAVFLPPGLRPAVAAAARPER